MDVLANHLRKININLTMNWTLQFEHTTEKDKIPFSDYIILP